MKVIQVGTRYEIYEDALETHDKLPAKTYIIRFSKMTGFFLEEHSPIEINEEKIYGVHLEKIPKVFNSFNTFERNLGIILSGHKGIGKSLFAKILSKDAIEKGFPVIIVDAFIPGIAAYIEKIQQEVVVLFDEFDKTFGNIKTGENEADPQAGLLSLFDGLAQGKKLFVITCNELRHLNDYLINRPGRFHYHFRFEYPVDTEVRTYLSDKVSKEYSKEIEKVVSFSRKVNLNYDCLRAIAFELNNGELFENAIKDLNILNTKNENYNVSLYLKDGRTITQKNAQFNLFDDDVRIQFFDKSSGKYFIVEFSPNTAVYDEFSGASVIKGSDISSSYNDGYDDEDEEEETTDGRKVSEIEVEMVTIVKVKDKSLHFAV